MKQAILLCNSVPTLDNSSPEERLMYAFCQYELNTACFVPDEQPDEEKLLELLRENRLILVAYHALSDGLKASFSPGFLERLRVEAHMVLKKQLALLQVTRALSTALKRADIPHVFLKGPALNQLLWGKRILRYSRDLDVLIHPADLFKVNDILNNLGFKAVLSEKILRFHQAIYRWTTKRDATYLKKDFPFPIELHWKVYARELVFKSWDEWLHQSVDTGCFFVFSDVEQVLYLCLHAANHGWSRLFWLMDIIAFIQKRAVDINTVRSLAKSRGIVLVVDEAIYLAKQKLGITLISEDAFLDCCLRPIRFKPFTGKFKALIILNFICSKKHQQLFIWSQVLLGAFLMGGWRRLQGLKSLTPS